MDNKLRRATSNVSPLLLPVPGRWVGLYTHWVARVSYGVRPAGWHSLMYLFIYSASMNEILHRYMYRCIDVHFFHIRHITGFLFSLCEWLAIFSLVHLNGRTFSRRFSKVMHMIKHSLSSPQTAADPCFCPCTMHPE